jgi:hypothetical protein
VKIGDLVKVNFPCDLSQVGIYVRDDTFSCGEDCNGYNVITRGEVFWDGDIISTPLDQLEVISESR